MHLVLQCGLARVTLGCATSTRRGLTPSNGSTSSRRRAKPHQRHGRSRDRKDLGESADWRYALVDAVVREGDVDEPICDQPNRGISAIGLSAGRSATAEKSRGKIHCVSKFPNDSISDATRTIVWATISR